VGIVAELGIRIHEVVCHLHYIGLMFGIADATQGTFEGNAIMATLQQVEIVLQPLTRVDSPPPAAAVGRHAREEAEPLVAPMVELVEHQYDVGRSVV